MPQGFAQQFYGPPFQPVQYGQPQPYPWMPPPQPQGQTLASLSTGPPSTIADDNDSAPGIDDEVERKGDSSFLPIKVTFLQQFYQQNVGY